MTARPLSFSRLLTFVTAFGLIAMSQSCGPTPCGSSTPYAELTLRSSGTVVDTRGTNPPETYSLGTECTANFSTKTARPGSSFPPARTPPLPGIRCEVGNGGFSISIPVLNDPREFEQGVHSWEDMDAATAPVQAQGPLGGYSVSFLAHGGVTVDVSEANGHAAPYPELVTSDYVRRFTVHAVAKQNADDVDGVVTIAIDLTAEQTAADVAQKTENVYCL